MISASIVSLALSVPYLLPTQLANTSPPLFYPLTGAVDITATVRIKCAAKECEEVDLCPICFSEGREPQGHKAWHDYKVVVSWAAAVVGHSVISEWEVTDPWWLDFVRNRQEKHSKPIFNEDWGADE